MMCGIMGQTPGACPTFMFKHVSTALVSVFFSGLVTASAAAQTPPKTAGDPPALSVEKGVAQAKSGHCNAAIPLLKKGMEGSQDKELKREAGFAGVRCAMRLNAKDAALYFLQFLNHEFPNDPDVLYVSVHTFSDLSTSTSLELARKAPTSYQAHQLNGEALEVQGKWDEAAKEYELVLKQNPHLAGIHYRLGRVLLSKSNFTPQDAQDAKLQFQQELEIDPSNAGAEFVLGVLARRDEHLGEAIGHFSRATQLDAGFGDAFLELGSALVAAKQFQEAIPPLETAVRLQPENPATHYNLATACSRVGRKEEADKEFAIHRQLIAKTGGAEASSPDNPSSSTPQ
jgi:tetratricopeptide (TPR) repeat protein